MTSSGARTEADPRPTHEGPEVQLGEADSGRTLPVKAGQIVEIRLPCNPTTGYNWYPCGIPAALSLKTDFTKASAPRLCGGSGAAIFLLSATQAGTFAAKFLRKRKWEEDGDAAKTFDITLVAQ